MKKFLRCMCALLSVSFLLLLMGCEAKTKTGEPTSMTTISNETTRDLSRRYFTMEDFEQFTIGETNFRDFYDALYTENDESYGMGAVPGGMAIDYPMENGKYIEVEFTLGETPEEMILREIEIVDSSPKDMFEWVDVSPTEGV